MLSGYRILDLTDDRGHLAGLMLAQLGAEVVLVEPPGGHRTRHRGPWIDDTEGPDRSIEFHAFNRGKASVVAHSPADVATLAETADAVIDCGAFDQAFATGTGVDLDALRAANPGLVTASISPFGLTGPKSDWAATDLTVAAASGTMSITGDQDRPPVRIGPPQVWLNAAADIAGAVLIALRERHRSGLGQHIDASAQESFMDCSQIQLLGPLVDAPIPKRLPGAVQLGDYLIPWVYQCADGHVTITFLFGPMMAPFADRLFAWMKAEGAIDDDLVETDWADFGMAVAEGRDTIATYDRASDAITAFAKTKTKAELLARALDDNLLIAPITTTADVLALDHLTDRQYWEQVPVPTGSGDERSVRFPGPMARPAKTALPPLAAAPRLDADAHSLPARPRTTVNGSSEHGGGRALEGLKVLDFMWAVAGPCTTRVLADYGATVVKVESESKLDVIRGVNPFIGEDGGQDNALQFHSFNAGKMSLPLDLGVAEARDVVFDLVRWADVLTESFSPRAMAAWGLGYEQLAEVNPELIMFSSCLMGQTGPMRHFAGFGTMAAAIAGFYPVTGWPDRMPAGPFTAYTDYVSPRLSVAIIMAALEQRDRDGRGQHIDFSQLEGALHFLAPQLLDEEINGRTAGRDGNADPIMCPHGVYRSTGDDRWIAIACETEDHWASLANLIGAPALAELSQAERRHRSAELDGLVEAWTGGIDNHEAQRLLQEAGVPAHIVADAAEVMADPQLAHRQHILQVPHPNHDLTWVEAGNFTLSRTPAEVRWGGPTLGQHTSEVLEEILGYDADRIAELIIAGAIA